MKTAQFKRVSILGCPFDAISFDETVARIGAAIVENRRLLIATGNVDFVMKARRDPRFREELWAADLVTADGVPILWAASWLGTPLRGRVNGTDLVWKCAELSARLGCSVALIGAGPGIAQRAASRLSTQFPGAKIFAIPTPFTLGPAENAALVERIRAIEAKIILAALGAPRQERWLDAHLDACGALVGIGIGSAFDIISGDMPRAPKWMREHGFEWLHRLMLEPRRLGRRYLIEDSPFFMHLLGAVARQRFYGLAGKH